MSWCDVKGVLKLWIKDSRELLWSQYVFFENLVPTSHHYFAHFPHDASLHKKIRIQQQVIIFFWKQERWQLSIHFLILAPRGPPVVCWRASRWSPAVNPCVAPGTQWQVETSVRWCLFKWCSVLVFFTDPFISHETSVTLSFRGDDLSFLIIILLINNNKTCSFSS